MTDQSSNETVSEPEIILPGQSVKRSGGRIDDEQLELVASLLDDAFAVPGTNWRFGLDAIIGLFPGIGDLITSTFSFLIVFSAWQRGLPRVTIARMLGNIAIDTLVGAMPLVGDLFDAAWKSNRKNVELLKRATVDHGRRQQARDWAALLLLVATAAAVIAVPVCVLIWLLRHAF